MNVMLVDDDQKSLESLSSALRLNGFHVKSFNSSIQALDIFRQYSPDIDVIVTDYHLPKMNGIELLKEIHKINPGIPVIIISGESKQNIEQLSLKANAIAFFQKPLNINHIIANIKKIK